MALFKILRGNETALPKNKTDGYAYFCTDTGSFFIDYTDGEVDLSGNLVIKRSKISAEYSDKLRYMENEEVVEIKATDIIEIQKELQELQLNTEHTNNQFANALKANVNGSFISVNDVSPVEHVVEVKVSGDGITLENVEVSVFGKNLIPYPFVNFTRESNGITATDLGDGGVLLNGTATATVFIYLHKTPIGNLYIEGSRTFNIGGTKCAITANRYSDAIRTVHHNNNHLTYIVITAGTVCDNIVFYPQIEVGAVATEFEKGIPYKIYKPNANGTIDGITSVSPYLNIFTDTDSVTLDVTYNKDSNMVIEKINERIDACDVNFQDKPLPYFTLQDEVTGELHKLHISNGVLMLDNKPISGSDEDDSNVTFDEETGSLLITEVTFDEQIGELTIPNASFDETTGNLTI